MKNTTTILKCQYDGLLDFAKTIRMPLNPNIFLSNGYLDENKLREKIQDLEYAIYSYSEEQKKFYINAIATSGLVSSVITIIWNLLFRLNS